MKGENMDYEEMVLEMQESDGNDCSSCPYAGIHTCGNQCMEIEKHWNPNLKGESNEKGRSNQSNFKSI